jgi:hypothetical protein
VIRNTFHDHRIKLDCTSGGERYGGLRVLFVSVLWLGLRAVAFARSKRDTASIVLLNFFLGWTMIGWVVALVWAFKTDVPVMVR